MKNMYLLLQFICLFCIQIYAKAPDVLLKHECAEEVSYSPKESVLLSSNIAACEDYKSTVENKNTACGATVTVANNTGKTIDGWIVRNGNFEYYSSLDADKKATFSNLPLGVNLNWYIQGNGTILNGINLSECKVYEAIIESLEVGFGNINATIAGCNNTGSALTITDRWNRVLNEKSIRLVDWQGHVHNPYVSLKIKGDNSINYPVDIEIYAGGSSRLMLDAPSTLSETGARKTIRLEGANEEVTVSLEIAPDRGGGFGEVEEYTFQLKYSNIEQCIPILVKDMDDDLEPSTNIKFDYRYAYERTDIYKASGAKNAAEQAIKDWFYFFDYDNFDMVPVGAEPARIVGNGFASSQAVSNNEPFNGHWVFMNTITGPYSTGFPTGGFHTIDGKELPTPLFRSSQLVLQLGDGTGTGLFTTLEDDDWWITGTQPVADVYGLISHEFGHAIAYAGTFPGFSNYITNYESANRVIDYQGVPIPIYGGHIGGGWDRISGQSGAYYAKFPPARWMLTKLTLLIAQEVGWPMRNIGPFLDYQIITHSLAKGKEQEAYNQKISSNLGGVPFYNWTLVSGSLPPGLSLDSFDGRIVGAPTKAGSYTFQVQLEDYDELSTPKRKTFTINIEETICSSTPYPYISENGSAWKTQASITVCSGQAFAIATQAGLQNGVSLTLPDGSIDNTPDGDTYFQFNNATSAMAGTYLLRYTDGNGCVATQEYNVTVNAQPDLLQYINVNGGGYSSRDAVTVCSGDEVILDFWGPYAGNWDYNFRRPDGVTIPGGANGSAKDQIRLPGVFSGGVNEGVWQATYTTLNGCSHTENFTINVLSSSNSACDLTSINCNYQNIYGLARDIGSGGGKTYVVGTNGQIFRLEAGYYWVALPYEFEGARLDVSGAGVPWVISTSNEIYYYINNKWSKISGRAIDIGCSGSTIYVVGTDRGIYKKTYNYWSRLPSGLAKRIDVGANGNPWVTSLGDIVHEYVNNSWKNRGSLKVQDLSIAEGGNELWVLANNDVVHEYIGNNTFKPNNGRATNISVGHDKKVWVVNRNNHIFGGVCYDSASGRSSYKGHRMEVFKSKGRAAEVQFVAYQTFEPYQYHIQHSTDNINFTTIGSLPASDAPDLDTYAFTDETPQDGQNYYQVVVEYEGGYQELIPSQSLDFAALENGDGITVFPNPAQDELFINLKPLLGQEGRLTIVNPYGQVMQEVNLIEIQDAMVKINTTSFQNGLYYLNIQVNKQKTITKKILISRLY